MAEMLDAAGHRVTVLDTESYSFRHLPSTFSGNALLGNGTDEDSLIKAGIKEADAFIAVTQGDNRNVMAAQIAKHIFNVPKVLCRIYDPLRQEIYQSLGIDAISPTTITAEILLKKLKD